MTNLTPPPAPDADPHGLDPQGLDPQGRDPQGTGPNAQPSPPVAGSGAVTMGRGAVTAITIAAAVLGGGALVMVGGTSALGAVSQVVTGNGGGSNTTTVDTTGVTQLEVEVGRGSATIRFGDVSAATMRSTDGSMGDWTMRRDGDTLRIERPNGPFGWWIGGWFGMDPQMTLTLPRELEGRLEADLDLNAGDLSTEGRFDDLEVTVNAGSLTIDGGAKTVTTQLNAGSATLRLEDVTTAELDMSAGDLNATISGRQPDLVRLDASAGSMDVTVPSGRYALSKDVSAGNMDTSIQTDPSSTHRIESSLSAGSITLREGS